MLADLLEKKRQESHFDYWYEYIGPGLIKTIKRLVFLRLSYVSYIFTKLTKSRFVSVHTETFWGDKINITRNSNIRYGFIFDPPEFKLTKFLISSLKSNDIFYDIGANIGFYSLLSSNIIKIGQIHCFEPLPDIFDILKSNLKSLPNVFLNNLALSNKEGDEKLYRIGNKSGFSTTIAEVADSYEGEKKEDIGIVSITLDSYIKDHNQPTVIKIDVEGGESAVIDGGERFLSNFSPTVIIEVWGGDKGRKFSSKALDKLIKFGYEPYFINYSGELERIISFDFDKVRDFDNFAFKKKSVT